MDGLDLDVDVHRRCLKNDVAVGDLTAMLYGPGLLMTVEHRRSDEILIFQTVFDQLEFEHIRRRAIVELDRVLVEHRTEWIRFHIRDDSGIDRIQMCESRKNNYRITSFETLH